jgi:hypothetical protein
VLIYQEVRKWQKFLRYRQQQGHFSRDVRTWGSVQLESGSFLMIELKSILLHLSHVATPYNLESHAVELVNFSHQCAKHIFNTLSILD